MSSYLVALVLHVVTAVLGLGLVSAVVVTAGAGGLAPEAKVALMRRFARGGSMTLGVMLLTGIAIMAATRGAGGEAWWLRGSMILLVLAGGSLGLVQRSLKGADKDAPRSVAMAGRFGALACVLLASIAVLMQAKPF